MWISWLSTGRVIHTHATRLSRKLPAGCPQGSCAPLRAVDKSRCRAPICRVARHAPSSRQHAEESGDAHTGGGRRRDPGHRPGGRPAARGFPGRPPGGGRAGGERPRPYRLRSGHRRHRPARDGRPGTDPPGQAPRRADADPDPHRPRRPRRPGGRSGRRRRRLSGQALPAAGTARPRPRADPPQPGGRQPAAQRRSAEPGRAAPLRDPARCATGADRTRVGGAGAAGPGAAAGGGQGEAGRQPRPVGPRDHRQRGGNLRVAPARQARRQRAEHPHGARQRLPNGSAGPPCIAKARCAAACCCSFPGRC